MLDRTLNLFIFTVTTTTTLAGCKLASEHCIGDCDLLTAGSQTTEPGMTTAGSMSSTTLPNSTSATTEPGATTTDGATEPGATTTTGASGTDGTTTGGTTGGGTTGGGTTGGPPVCPCILDDEGFDMLEPSPPICGEALCPTIEIDRPNWGCDVAMKGEEIGLVNPEALACALAALRDRTPGVINWSCNVAQSSNDSGYVLIGGDGTAIRRRWGWEGLNVFDASDALEGALPDPGVFEQCLADDDDATRFECLRKFMLGEPTLVCDEGWDVVFG